MLTPGYALTATERILPSMALDFTTGVLDPRVTFTRALNTATRTNASGLIEVVNANLPRFDYDPVTLAPRGLLIELSRANLFLNSLIDGTNLVTQSVTLAASAYTLSFYGSGSVTISGGHSATVSGTGNYPNRITYSFTPTAGSSTFSVSGDVKYAQVELGAFATSFIPTTTSLTRNADNVSMTGTNFSDWFNASEGTLLANGSWNGSASATALFAVISNGGNSNRMLLYANNSAADAQFTVFNGGTPQADIGQLGATSVGEVFKAASAYKANDFAAIGKSGSVSTDTSGTVPSVNVLHLGSNLGSSNFLNGYIRQISYWKHRITNAEMQAFTKL